MRGGDFRLPCCVRVYYTADINGKLPVARIPAPHQTSLKFQGIATITWSTCVYTVNMAYLNNVYVVIALEGALR